MRKLSFGVLLIALSTLILELMLTRIFDVVITPNIAYVVVTAAVFGFGLAGVYATIRPFPANFDVESLLVRTTVVFSAITILLVPLINLLNLDYTHMGTHFIAVPLSYIVLYGALVTPFFLSGYVLIAVFTTYSERIQRLYFYDLVGAGIGSIASIPFVRHIGPGGLMICAGATGLLSAALFSTNRVRSLVLTGAAVVVAAIPFIHAPEYFDFRNQTNKREVQTFIDMGLLERVYWDPISKITVMDETWKPEIARPWHESGDRKAIQYDDGNQSSYFYRFDGDLVGLRERLSNDLSRVNEHFWQVGVLGSHYLKRDSNQEVLILGSAGGQETKAALMYGAAKVDAVEMVPTVVELGVGPYSEYIGNIFHHPAVSVRAGEGRSFLRSTDRKYDIIQIYSNHTSSSIQQGSGALSPAYLQTAEAYKEYFSHLKPDGVLHINHHVYPRMLTTAALAWKEMGMTDFKRHVIVFFAPHELTLPTVMFKMSPWTAEEVAQLESLYAHSSIPEGKRLTIVEHPLRDDVHFLSDDFFAGVFPPELAALTRVNFTPRTDNRPYFGMLRKELKYLKPDQATFTDPGSAYILNLSVDHGVAMDWAHFFVVGALSLFFVIAFVVVPLRFSQVGRQQGVAALPMVGYFACLGAGFIVIELVLIQKFTHLIGSPLYTYSTVIFSMLLAAGLGSAASGKLKLSDERGWQVPFIGVLVTGTALVLLYSALANLALSLPLPGRVLAAGAMIFPVGFFLGMPFPLGVLAIRDRPPGAVAWAWGMNGLFTVVGGLVSVLASVAWGFNNTLLGALALYAVAFALYPLLRSHRAKVPVAAPAPVTG